MRTAISAAIVALVLAGCAGAKATVDSNEDLLAGAGFAVLAGDTGGYAAAARQLPPHKFVHHTEQGILTYYYFDPTICGCLYYGSQRNWDVYRQEMAEQRHIQAEDLLVKDDTPYEGHGGV
jgi:hypothetical protein